MKHKQPKKQISKKILPLAALVSIVILIVFYGSAMICVFDPTFIISGVPQTESCFAVAMWHNFNTLFIPATITNDPRWIVATGLIMWTGVVIIITKIFRK